MTTSQINDVIGRMWKSNRAARVARACRTLCPALYAFDRNKNVELPRKASVFLHQSYKSPSCTMRTRRTKCKIPLLAQSFIFQVTFSVTLPMCFQKISVCNLMLSMSMLDFPNERLSGAFFLEKDKKVKLFGGK